MLMANEGATAEVFAFQDRIAAQVAGPLKPAIRRAEIWTTEPEREVAPARRAVDATTGLIDDHPTAPSGD